MNLTQELANLDIPAAIRAAILAQFELVKSQATTIESLAMEIAYLRRMRYGAKTEAMSAEQRDLFEEALDADMAALEARLAAEQANNTPEVSDKKPRMRAGR